MGKILNGKFGRKPEKSATDRFFEETERRLLLDYVTLTVTYKENGSMTDEVIEEITGPPNHSGSGFEKRDMGWVFPKEDMKKVNVLVTKLQALTGISIDINLTDADGNPN
jgi:hypothetical protein